MVDLVKVAKSLREKSNLLARVDAARAARARFSEVRAPYALPCPITRNRPLRVEAPTLAPGFEYRTAERISDNPAYHQTVQDNGEIESYSHECADWQKAVPLTRPMGRTINPGRTAQITAQITAADTVSAAPRPSVQPQRPAPLKLWRGKRCAPSMNPGRGAEMLVTDRPIAESRPAFTRRHPHIYALARSATYVSSLHALREAILRPIRVEFEIADCRRHVADARMALGSAPHKILSERLP